MTTFLLLLVLLSGAYAKQQWQTTKHVTSVDLSDPDPAQPTQPQDIIIIISNFCNTTSTISNQSRNLWEGTFKVDLPNTIASEHSSHFKYGFEVQADPKTKRINGTVLYENPFVYVDFFSVVGEWGVAIEHQDITVETTQADVGDLSIYLRRYNIIVGQSQTC